MDLFPLARQGGGTWPPAGHASKRRRRIKKFGRLGGDLVGMTLVPEVFLARELELCYTALCYVVNFAEGVKDRPYQNRGCSSRGWRPGGEARLQAVGGGHGGAGVCGSSPALAAAPRGMRL